MRYSTRQRIIKYMIWVGIAAIIVVINIGVFFIIKPVASLDNKLIKLDASIYSNVFSYDEGILVVDGKTLSCLDLQGKALFTVEELPQNEMKASKNGDITIVWDKKTAHVYNKDGELILEKELQGANDEILLARAGARYFALATIEEGQYRARIYNYEAKDIDNMLFPSMSTIDLGFYGDSGNLLWVLLIDSHGTLPISKIRTDQPGKSMTGSITVVDQICYQVTPLNNVVHTVGTHHIQSWSYTNVKQSEKLIYGWTMQDYFMNDDKITYLLGSSQEGEVETPLSALWYIGADDVQYRLSMPTGIKKAVLGDEEILAISDQGIYIYNVGKSNSVFNKMPFMIEEVSTIINGKAVVLKSKDAYYLLPTK